MNIRCQEHILSTQEDNKKCAQCQQDADYMRAKKHCNTKMFAERFWGLADEREAALR